MIHEIDGLLARMVAFLKMASRNDLATALERHRSDLVLDPVATESRLLSLFGGMGSLNDIVLYKDGRLLREESNEFDELKSRLYELCLKEVQGQRVSR